MRFKQDTEVNAVKLMLVAGVALLAGCVVIDPAVQVGPNQYRAEAEWGGDAGPEHQAKDTANKKCASLGKSVAEMSIETHDDDRTGGHHGTIRFECH